MVLIRSFDSYPVVGIIGSLYGADWRGVADEIETVEEMEARKG